VDPKSIEINPELMMGKPVLKGTTVTVESILRRFAEGASEDQILADFPGLTREDIRAAIRYAADALPNGESRAQATRPRGNRRHELERLKAARFPAEGKEQRVAAARRVLETLRFGMPVDIEIAKWAAEDAELEDF
jgi:uncharacterized protein (DUF433 family)